jgi:hypothetical protein
MHNTVASEIALRAQSIIQNLLPSKSAHLYQKEYDDFKIWQGKNGIESISEDVMLIYIDEKSKLYKPTTLWSKLSMLKTTLNLKENVNIENFS